jgi:hypothetical protein
MNQASSQKKETRKSRNTSLPSSESKGVKQERSRLQGDAYFCRFFLGSLFYPEDGGQYVTLKRRSLSEIHSVKPQKTAFFIVSLRSQKIELFITTAVRISKPTDWIQVQG